jgi:hypothetical protein
MSGVPCTQPWQQRNMTLNDCFSDVLTAFNRFPNLSMLGPALPCLPHGTEKNICGTRQ